MSDNKLQLPAYAWPAAAIVVLAGAGLTIYTSVGGYEHITDGYVGPEKCRECHERQYASWAKTRMAKSFDVLRPGAAAEQKKMAGLDPDVNYTEDANCIPCHTTGYGRVGGYRSIEETPHMRGVTCEACHGPGGMYAGTIMSKKQPSFETATAVEAGLVYPPTEEVCRTCHNEDSPFVDMDYVFEFSQRVKAGTHDHFRLKYEHGEAND